MVESDFSDGRRSASFQLLQQARGAGGMPPSHPTDEYRRKKGAGGNTLSYPKRKEEMPMHSFGSRVGGRCVWIFV